MIYFVELILSFLIEYATVKKTRQPLGCLVVITDIFRRTLHRILLIFGLIASLELKI